MIGAGVLGAFSLGAGFVHDKVTLFVLRGFAGVCAAMTIPSALSLIVENFPTQPEQGVALSLFAGTGGLSFSFYPSPTNSAPVSHSYPFFLQLRSVTCSAY